MAMFYKRTFRLDFLKAHAIIRSCSLQRTALEQRAENKNKQKRRITVFADESLREFF
jgi:hypothetical protein